MSSFEVTTTCPYSTGQLLFSPQEAQTLPGHPEVTWRPWAEWQVQTPSPRLQAEAAFCQHCPGLKMQKCCSCSGELVTCSCIAELAGPLHRGSWQLLPLGLLLCALRGWAGMGWNRMAPVDSADDRGFLTPPPPPVPQLPQYRCALDCLPICPY